MGRAPAPMETALGCHRAIGLPLCDSGVFHVAQPVL
jgi:hypothetical protein